MFLMSIPAVPIPLGIHIFWKGIDKLFPIVRANELFKCAMVK